MNEVSIDTSSFAKFSRDLKRAEPVLARELRKDMLAAGEVVAVGARTLARGFSRKGDGTDRIPANIKVGVAGNRIRVYVPQKRAPEARVIEHGGQPGTFRHPVFGNPDVWVSQPAHPFLHPAADAARPAVVVLAKRAIDKALSEVHSHG